MNFIMKNLKIFFIIALFIADVNLQEQKTFTEEEVLLKQNEFLKTAEQIENENPLTNLNSNTTTFTLNISGRWLTTKMTIFSIGNKTEGAFHIVISLYLESRNEQWIIKTFEWYNNGKKNSYDIMGYDIRGIDFNNQTYLIKRKENSMIKNNFTLEENQTLEIAKLIENGNAPVNVKKSNTTSLTMNVNGKQMTIKITSFHIGFVTEGSLKIVETIFEDSEIKDWAIDTFIWNGTRLSFHHHRMNGGIIS
ncbi:uncharacterized protein LOC127290529 isoform X1 [Leptopilina boulardi]|uniref:uncharacterized protein LOC127290529 isoform X1 n=1 Tax=Leptopilina boulardi TaxID=63433 RepID=UPI0021F58EFA|nr:uncharacterized protein LOC127290529 isoform X1 [Leptopilina boulardi]